MKVLRRMAIQASRLSAAQQASGAQRSGQVNAVQNSHHHHHHHRRHRRHHHNHHIIIIIIIIIIVVIIIVVKRAGVETVYGIRAQKK